MKWTVKLVAESTSGHPVEQEIATLELEDLVPPPSLVPATLWLTLPPSKQQELMRLLVRMIEQHLQTNHNTQEVHDDAHRPR